MPISFFAIIFHFSRNFYIFVVYIAGKRRDSNVHTMHKYALNQSSKLEKDKTMRVTSPKKYLPPRTLLRGLETEGILCQSIDVAPNADEIHNINADDSYSTENAKSYFEF